MKGPELGVQADDVEAPGLEQESKQEVLENKSVRTGTAPLMFMDTTLIQAVKLNQKLSLFLGVFLWFLTSGGGPAGSHRWPLQNQGGPPDSRDLRSVPGKESH